MDTKKLRQDVLDNLDKLPEKFGDGSFYDSFTGLACFYGWLASLVSEQPVTEMVTTLESGSMAWSILDKRYGSFGSAEPIAADRIIRAAGGHPKVVVDQILASLEEPTNG